MTDNRGGQFASDAGEGSPVGTWPELGVEDPRRLGLSYAIPMSVWLDEAHGKPVLRYGSRYEGGPPYPRQPANASALTEFTVLADQPEADFPTAVLQFAQRWGPLDLCEHDQPQFHPPSGPHAPPAPVTKGAMQFKEPVEPWRRFSRSAAATLSILSDLTEGTGLGTLEAWWNAAWGRPYREPACADGRRVAERETAPGQLEIVAAPTGDGAATVILPPSGFGWESWPARVPESVSEAAAGLALCVTNWVNVAGVAPELRPREGLMGGRPQWAATLALGSLSGQLAGELVALLVSGRGAFRCASCGQPYTVPSDGHHRSPAMRSGHAHYCPRCGAAASKRQWERRHMAERSHARAEARAAAKAKRAAESGVSRDAGHGGKTP